MLSPLPLSFAKLPRRVSSVHLRRLRLRLVLRRQVPLTTRPVVLAWTVKTTRAASESEYRIVAPLAAAATETSRTPRGSTAKRRGTTATLEMAGPARSSGSTGSGGLGDDGVVVGVVGVVAVIVTVRAVSATDDPLQSIALPVKIRSVEQPSLSVSRTE